MLNTKPPTKNIFSELDIAQSSINIIAKINVYIIILSVIIGCESNQSNTTLTDNIQNSAIEFNFQPQIKYAKGFSIDVSPFKKTVRVFNPSNGNEEMKLSFLNTHSETAREENELIFDEKINSIIPLSTSFYSMIEALGELDKIVAIENSNFVYNPKILKHVTSGKIEEVGAGTEINAEKIIRIYPDLLLLNNTPNTNIQLQKLDDAGINIATNFDWYEENGLAKAEWIKFFGALFNKDSLADAIFNRIESRYFELKNISKGIKDSTVVLFSSDYSGTWYIPGGKSYVTQLMYDAGGTYHWKYDNSTASLPLSMEVVVAKALDDDVWISPNAKTLEELANQQEVYKEFKPYKTGNVYLNELRINEHGGNDYYESGTLHPDWILQDYIKMLHPELMRDSSFIFFKKME